MKRRNFIYDSSLLAFSVGVFGKIKWDGHAFVGNDPTTTDILGPFYRPGAPFRTDLVQPGTKGEILHFSGIIYEKDGKTPVNSALVEIWHCNENGEYDNTSDDYIYRSAWKTGSDGKYYFKTILPVQYGIGQGMTRPAHIHMRISGNQQQDLVTQIYFKGDNQIANDQSASDPKSMNRILPIAANAKNEKVVTFDVVLHDEYLLEKNAYTKITGLYQMKDNSMCEFYHEGDQLFLKINGQIMEAMDYKGNNRFEGGLGLSGALFELQKNGGVTVKINFKVTADRTIDLEGTKLIKYPG